MSTRAQLLYSAVHGTAMRYAAERRDLAESIAELRELGDGHDEVLAEAAGITPVLGTRHRLPTWAMSWSQPEC
jgi:hypothetical protein